MMLLFLGYDRIDIQLPGKQVSIGRKELEWQLGPSLLELIKENAIQDVYVVNGPGSFTNIRIGSLVVNSIGSLPDASIKLHNIDSLSFYTYFVQQGILPDLGYIFIGQRKKCWLYDFSKKEHKLVDIPENIEGDTCFVEHINDRSKLANQVCFALQADGDISVEFLDTKKTARLADIGFESVTHINADYMIEPNIHR